MCEFYPRPRSSKPRNKQPVINMFVNNGLLQQISYIMYRMFMNSKASVLILGMTCHLTTLTAHTYLYQMRGKRDKKCVQVEEWFSKLVIGLREQRRMWQGTDKTGYERIRTHITVVFPLSLHFALKVCRFSIQKSNVNGNLLFRDII